MQLCTRLPKLSMSINLRNDGGLIALKANSTNVLQDENDGSCIQRQAAWSMHVHMLQCVRCWAEQAFSLHGLTTLLTYIPLTRLP